MIKRATAGYPEYTNKDDAGNPVTIYPPVGPNQFPPILTGEIVELYIVIGAKSKTKRYRFYHSQGCSWAGVETATIDYEMYTILISNRYSSSVAVLKLVATKHSLHKLSHNLYIMFCNHSVIDLVSRYFMKINYCSLITAFKSYRFVCAYTHYAVGWMSRLHTSPHLYTANYISYNRPMPFSPGV